MNVAIKRCSQVEGGKASCAVSGLREFSVLVSVRIADDRPEAERELRAAVHDVIMMIPDVVDMNVDTIVEVQL